MPVNAPASPVGRTTALVLGLVVFVCVAMIGGTGYMKYNLDRAQAALAAPGGEKGEATLAQLRDTLGYGGFLGKAQLYVSAHDASGVADMRAAIKTASDLAAHLPDQTPPEARRDVEAITAIFSAALKKIDAAPGEAPDFTAADLTPLYAALPTLDARAAALDGAARAEARQQTQLWSMLLTLACWGSLILAAACAAGVYLALRDKQSAPLRALAQSIQNMARGDMRTAIWGIERQDTLGDLARAVDLARYHFSQLPDMSLMSEDGPVRMRFEGGARSLFEAMMTSISKDSETIREQATGLSLSIAEQRESLIALTEKVQSTLNNMLANGQSGDKLLRQTVQDMSTSAENLKNAHAHAADQLSRLIPTMQERMQGMAEIAQLTGKQVAHTLQSLTLSGMNLKTNTEQAQETLAKLTSTADDLGTRMFGAINLLQASGKVLAETTEKIQSTIVENASPVDAELVQPLTDRLDQVADKLAAIQHKLDTPPEAEEVALAPGALDQAEFEHTMAQIRDKLEELSLAVAQHESTPSNVEEQLVPALLSGVEQLLAERERNAPAAEQAAAAPQNDAAFEQILAKLETLSAPLGAPVMVSSDSASPASLAPDLLSGIERLLGETLDGKIASLENVLADKIRERFEAFSASLDEYKSIVLDGGAATQNEIKTTLANMESRFSELATALPADLRASLSDDLDRLSAQIEASGGLHAQVLGGKIDLKLSKLEEIVEHQAQENTQGARQAFEEMSAAFDARMDGMPQQIEQSLQDHTRSMGSQIDGLRMGIAKLLDDHVASRLMAFEGTLNSTKDAVEAAKIAAETPPKAIVSLPPDVQAQMHDQWYQVISQIEAMRANLADTIAYQVGELSQRLSQAAPPASFVSEPSAAPLPPTFAGKDEVQKQLDQQTEILSELVATLGVLDAHMEQIKTELRAKVG